ncbi:hypothetical protein ACIO1C_29490 [Streptomyces sp. NPDC087420]|uniref:hypothetical protein n=1 Tax=Streptomyces sp. NPDC087420 TaxID=3365785 RepID=UPI0038389AD8
MTTEAVTETVATEDFEAESGPSFPEFPLNPNNHLYTISMDGRGPMIVVRGNTPQEINERYQALMDAGTTSVAAAVFSHMKAEMAVAQGLGPVSAVPAPQGPPAPALPPQGQFPAAQQQFNQQPAQQFPGAPGTAPAAWQNAGAPAGGAAVQDNTAEYRQAGWYKLTVGFGGPKAAFDALVTQYGMRKGRPTEGGQVSFNKANKSWHVTPEAVQAFGQFTPVPA